MKKILLFLAMFFVCNICYAQLGQVSKIEQKVESMIAATSDPAFFYKAKINSTNQYYIVVSCCMSNFMLKKDKYSDVKEITIGLGDNKEKAIQSITYLIKTFDNNNTQNITDSFNQPFSILTTSCMGIQIMIITADDENMTTGIITKDILDFFLYKLKLNKE